MRKIKLLIFIMMGAITISLSAKGNDTEMMRGVVYDCGLLFGGKNLSLEVFDERQVEYDMDVIANILNCNTIRLEGEDIGRLHKATLLAH